MRCGAFSGGPEGGGVMRTPLTGETLRIEKHLDPALLTRPRDDVLRAVRLEVEEQARRLVESLAVWYDESACSYEAVRAKSAGKSAP